MRSLQKQLEFCLRAQQMLLVGAVVLAAGFYLFGYRPVTQRLSDLHMQIDSKQRALASNQTRAAALPAVAREVEALQARLERFDKKLPRQHDVDQFIRDTDGFGARPALRNFTNTPGPTRRQDLFFELPITLRFQGDFVSVHTFLRQLEEMQRLTRVRSLQLRNRDVRSGLVDVELTTTIFFLDEP